MTKGLIITPKTKVLQLIEEYPKLEEVLINYVPSFSKLRNPVLRRTVARIATLQQAASIGNVKVDELINVLRREVGQDLYQGAGSTDYNTSQPSWYSEGLIVQELDARAMLESGEQPVNQVLSDLNSLPEGKIYKLLAPFLPAPVIDKASSLGLKHWVDRRGEEEFVIYFLGVAGK